MDNPDTIQRAETARPSRRGLLRVVGVGGVATAFAATGNAASAQETGTTVPDSSPPAPTTTSPPKQPSTADLEVLAVAKTYEMTAAQGYLALTAERLASLGYDEATAEFLRALSPAHRAYAEQLSALYGPGSPGDPSDGLAAKLAMEALATGDAATVLATAQKIELVGVDSYLAALDQVQSTDAAKLIASIQIVEARHAIVLGHLQGEPYDAGDPAIQDGALALTAADIAGEQ